MRPVNGFEVLIRATLLVAVAMLGVATAETQTEDKETPSFDTYKILMDRNIFNPSRVPNKPDEGPAAPAPYQARTMRLMGTVLTEHVKLALFEGDSEAPRSGAKPGDTLVGYTVEDIRTDGITLKNDAGSAQVAVGAGLSRQEDGKWVIADRATVQAQPAPANEPAAGSTPATAPAPAPGADAKAKDTQPAASDGDALEKLRQRRRQELGR